MIAEKFADWPEAPGTVLPLLWGMQRQGLLQAHWVMAATRMRKQYQITEAGLAAYRKWMLELETLLQELRLPEG